MISASLYYRCTVTEQTVNFFWEAPGSDIGQTIAILAGIFFQIAFPHFLQ